MNTEILLADDDDGVAELVRRALAQDGCRVTTVTDGRDAVSAAEFGGPAVVLLDVGLPGRSGWEILTDLRARAATRLLPVIMLTGHAADEDKEDGFLLGADDYVTKPFSPRELRARVLGHLRRHREAVSVNPLTGLPGSPSIQAEVERRLHEGRAFCLLHADIDRFKAYNDAYGYERGDAAIKALADVLREALRESGDGDGFLGHVGGDDFVMVCSEDKAELAAAFAVMRFDEAVASLYDDGDRARGWVAAADRAGLPRRSAPMSLTIGGASSTRQRLTNYAEAVRRADAVKAWLKALKSSGGGGPSFWALDRRHVEPTDTGAHGG